MNHQNQVICVINCSTTRELTYEGTGNRVEDRVEVSLSRRKLYSWYGMVWYGNSLFDITEKYIVIAKYLIKYMIYVWRLHKEYIG